MAGMDILKALAALEESGIVLTKEQQAALAEHKTKAFTEAAETVFGRKLSDKKKASKWTTEMFALASKVESDFPGENKGRGRGEVFERVFRIDTPTGTLKVSLTQGAKDDDDSDE